MEICVDTNSLYLSVMTSRRQEIKQWLKEVNEDNLRDIYYRAFIFGSQTNKEELIRSDIDVGILADKPFLLLTLLNRLCYREFTNALRD